MKPFHQRILFLAVFLAFFTDGFSQIPESIKKEIRNRISTGLNPSIALAVYDETGTQIVVEGHADPLNKKAATANTLYRLGSLGNTLTGLLAAELHKAKYIDIFQPISQLSDDYPDLTDLQGKAITLQDILAYKSGIEDETAFILSSTASWKALENNDQVEEISPYAAGEVFSYSDWAMGLAAESMSTAMGSTYANLLFEEILDGSALKFKYLKEGETSAQLALGIKASNAEIPYIKSESMLWAASITDLLAYGKFIQSPPPGQSEVVALTTKTHFVSEIGINTGLGWLKDHQGNLYHAGHYPGFNTFLAIDRKHKKVIALATNTDGADISDLGLYLLSPEENPLRPYREIAIDPVELSSYEGYYINEALGLELELQVNEGELRSIHKEDTVSLHFMGEHCFFYEGLKAHLDFERDHQDRVVGVTLNDNGKEVMFIKLN
ncbi:serine hydrolase domain-containing protein [Robertkochia marina]|uniref:serine hydrolase domain-containing protein n=1 Tax=Robertkochia marina TaxID=1227945 RepID=UPI001454D3AD|nr:serine hydrolase domain-containing protein [Robertkochia marina]